MERKRYQISFRLEDARHVEALAHFEKQANRSDFVVLCILKAEEQGELLAIVRDTIQDCLRGVKVVSTSPNLPLSVGTLSCPMPESGEISEELLHFMEEF